jgi:hypothetical protein
MAIMSRTDGGRIIWEWVVPNAVVESTAAGPNQRTKVIANFADSNWADDNDETEPDKRVDKYPNSILDFVFVAKGACSWRARSRVIVRPGDFPDTAHTSDHRPVEAVLELLQSTVRSEPVGRLLAVSSPG